MNSEKIFRIRFHTALFNFLLIALIGTTLRYVFIHEIKIVPNFTNVMHAHSHAAMLGWIFMALYSCLLYAFLPEVASKKIYNILFWCNQIAMLGMIISFWQGGYTIPSIIFLTIHVFITYFFTILVFKDVRGKTFSNLLTKHLLYIGLFFLVFSSVGVWSLIPVSILLQSSMKVLFTYLSVQFYLHFQYNGWFIFGCLALFFSMKNVPAATINRKSVSIVYMLALCTIVTYSFDIFWGFQHYKIYLNISVVVAGIQLILTVRLFAINSAFTKGIMGELKPGVKALFIVSFCSLLLKELIQVIIIYPGMAQTVFILRNYIVAYLHLIFLGVTTTFLLGYTWQKGVLVIQSVVARFSIALIVSCIFIIELLLAIMGSLSWAGKSNPPIFYALVFAFSLSIVTGILILFVINRIRKR